MSNFWISVLALTLISTPLASQERDTQLEEAVRARLKSDKLDGDVAEVVAIDGVVTLRGKARNAYLKMQAIEVALAVEGVESVEDELEVAAAESGEDLAKDLVDVVLRYPNYTVFDDVGFQLLDDGVVVVTGYVTMEFKKKELQERLAKVAGIREIQNQLELLPVSQNDDAIRRRLFDNIYRHELFFAYANRTHPPIHLIVKKGNVILTGAVRNRIESRQAESIARSTFGVFNVENRLQVSN